MVLYCCCSSRFPEYFYDFNIFQISFIHTLHFYLRISQFQWWPFSSPYDCTNPFILTQCCSNVSISRTKSITLINSHDLEHCVVWVVFTTIWKKDTIYRVEVVSDLNYDLCSCVRIAVNKILTEYGHLVKWHCDLGEGNQMTMCHHHPITSWKCVQWHYDCLFWESQTPEHHHNPTKYFTWFSDTTIGFYGSFKLRSIVINRAI